MRTNAGWIRPSLRRGLGLRLIGLGLAASVGLGGCGPALVPAHLPEPGIDLTGRAIPARCGSLRSIDWRRFDPWIDRYDRRQTKPLTERAQAMADRQAVIDRIVIAPDAPHRPSAEAVIVMRAYVGAFRTEHLGMTWREPDGQWWFHNQRLDWEAPQAPPPPPWEPQGPPQTIDRRFPPVSGRLSQEAAARMEAAWSDECRAWEPDSAPWHMPLRRPEVGSRSRWRECPGGGAPITGEIREPGRAPRLVHYPCNQPFTTDRLLTMTAFSGVSADD